MKKSTAIIFSVSLALFALSCKKTPSGCKSELSVSGIFTLPDSGTYKHYYMVHPVNSQKKNLVKWLPVKGMDFPVSTVSPDGSLYYVSSSADESIFEINSSTGEINKTFYIGNYKGPTFIHHLKKSPKIITAATGIDKKLRLTEIDIYSGAIQNLGTIDFQHYIAMRSLMLDENIMTLYYVDSERSLMKVQLPNGTPIKVCDVPMLSNHWFLDAEEGLIYSVSSSSPGVPALYEVNLNNNQVVKLEEFPQIKMTILGGSAYDAAKNKLLLMDPDSKLLYNINVKTLSTYSEPYSTNLTNLSMSKACFQ